MQRVLHVYLIEVNCIKSHVLAHIKLEYLANIYQRMSPATALIVKYPIGNARLLKRNSKHDVKETFKKHTGNFYHGQKQSDCISIYRI